MQSLPQPTLSVARGNRQAYIGVPAGHSWQNCSSVSLSNNECTWSDTCLPDGMTIVRRGTELPVYWFGWDYNHFPSFSDPRRLIRMADHDMIPDIVAALNDAMPESSSDDEPSANDDDHSDVDDHSTDVEADVRYPQQN